MSARPSSFDATRLRRAVLDAVAAGEAYLLTVHDRLRWSTRPLDVEQLRAISDELAALESAGLVRSRMAGPDARMRLDRPRRLYTITLAGMQERERLAVQ